MNKKTFLEVRIYFNDCLTPFFILQLSAKVAYFLNPFTDITANCRSKQDTSSHNKFTNGRCVNVKRVELLKIFVCLKETLRNSFILGSDQK